MILKPDHIAGKVAILARAPLDKQYTTLLKLISLRGRVPYNTEFSRKFTAKKVIEALKDVKNAKAPGFDKVHPEFLLHCDQKARKSLASCYSHILTTKNF